MAQVMDQKFKGLSPVAIFMELADRYSPTLLLALVGISIIATAGFVRARIPFLRMKAMAVIGAAVLMMTPMLLLYSISGTSDMRRIMPAMLLLYVGLAGIALSPLGVLPRIRTAIVVVLALVQFTTVSANGFGNHAPVLVRAQQLLGGGLRWPATERDPNVPVLDGILALGIDHGNIAAYSYCYRDYGTCWQRGAPPFEPSALATLARERHLPIVVHFIGDLDFTKPDSLAGQIAVRDYQYLLVDMFDAPAVVNLADPYTQHTQKFIALERGGLPVGLTNVGCFSTLNRPICAVKVQKP
jgi:hypothetical protein